MMNPIIIIVVMMRTKNPTKELSIPKRSRPKYLLGRLLYFASLINHLLQ